MLSSTENGLGGGVHLSRSSIEEWIRVDSLRSDIDTALSPIHNSLASDDGSTRAVGLATVLRLLKSLEGKERRSVFAIVQSTTNNPLHEALFAIVKLQKFSAARRHVEQSEDTAELLQALDVLAALCLLHYASKAAARRHIPLLLTLFSSRSQQTILATLSVLESILVDSSENTTVFEVNGGVEIVCRAMRVWRDDVDVAGKCVELFTIYLSDEADNPDHPPLGVDRVDGDVGARLVGEKVARLEALMGSRFVSALLVSSSL